MNDPENFVARWSRRKRETGSQQKETADASRSQLRPANTESGASAGKPASNVPETDAVEPPFDLTKLPPIESITSATDIRAFLQSGVPAELTKAALRRAWTADPEIRDFIGLAENQWDFTDPTAIPGFGPLGATDNVRELVSRSMGELAKVSEPESAIAASGVGEDTAATASHVPSHSHSPPQVSGMPDGNAGDDAGGVPVEDKEKTASAAPQHDDGPTESKCAGNRRGHGRALPR